MSNYAVKKIDEMDAMYLGSFKRARASLGVESFGLGIIDLPPGFEHYPEHDHSEDGQEEVYIALSGRAEIEIDGETHTLEPETMAMIGPGVKRKVRTGEEGIRMLVVGGIPGQAYAAPDVSRLGAPDPAQSS